MALEGLQLGRSSRGRQVSRRGFLAGVAGIIAAGVAPEIFVRRGDAAGRVLVRNPGGSFADHMKISTYDPFTKETGIEVVTVPANGAKILAMVESGNVELDVVDVPQLVALIVNKRGALVPINYGAWRYTKPDDIDASFRRPTMVGSWDTASTLWYNTKLYSATGKHPRSWAEYWDIKSFSGPRMMEDFNAEGFVELEFALIADGVPVNKLYPIDINRALKSYSRVKPSIVKFFDTGAIMMSMATSGEALLGSVWQSRLQEAIDQGGPYAVEWDHAMLQTQYTGVLKGAPNPENAQLYVDFSMRPQSLAEFGRLHYSGPTNRQALKLLPPDVATKLPSHPSHNTVFHQNSGWWLDHHDEVGQRWTQWQLQKS